MGEEIELIRASLVGAPPEIRGFFDGERDQAREILAGGRTTKDVAALTIEAAARLDPFVAQMTAKQPPACSRGCSWCCRGLKVDTTAPEAIAIAEFFRWLLKDDFPAGATEAAEQAATMRELDTNTRWAQQTPCAFLDEESGDCWIYPVRPFACRAHASMNASQCERAAADPAAELGIDKAIVPATFFGLAKSAITMACHEAGLDTRSFELTNAVSVAMNEPGAAEQWARGESVFDAAVIPSDAEDREVARRDLMKWGLVPPERLVRRHHENKPDKNAAKRARKAQREARKKGRK